MKLAQLYADKMDRKADARDTLRTAYKILKDPKIKAELDKLDS